MSPIQGRRRPRRALARRGVISGLASLLLAAGVSPAFASVTLGQLAPADPEDCGDGFDVLQPTVTSGNTYVSPATGTVTSWSTRASPVAGKSLSMKIFRKVADPVTYTVVGHDGPRPLNAGAVNTFPTSIPVNAGDVLGLHTGPVNDTGCIFPVPGESFPALEGSLGDGQSGVFEGTETGFRLNITAIVEPSNTITLGKPTLNKKKGTATIAATVPNAGELTASGRGVKRASGAGARTAVSVAAPGTVKLKIRAKGRKKATLNETGRVKVKPTITYTPTEGTPRAQPAKLKLKKNL